VDLNKLVTKRGGFLGILSLPKQIPDHFLKQNSVEIYVNLKYMDIRIKIKSYFMYKISSNSKQKKNSSKISLTSEPKGQVNFSLYLQQAHKEDVTKRFP
jgi:hypothetical protein